MHCIGMDVHSKATNFCVMDPNGKRVREFSLRGPLQGVVARIQVSQRQSPVESRVPLSVDAATREVRTPAEGESPARGRNHGPFRRSRQ